MGGVWSDVGTRGGCGRVKQVFKDVSKRKWGVWVVGLGREKLVLGVGHHRTEPEGMRYEILFIYSMQYSSQSIHDHFGLDRD